MSRWGVYIAGPGIRGWMLMSQPGGAGGSRVTMVFGAEGEARGVAYALQAERPHHFVEARPYVAGDEDLGELAAAAG